MEEFKIQTAVCFGADALNCLKNLTATRIFIVTDPFMVESKMVDRITEQLKEKEYMIFSNVVPDPPLELVVEGVREVMAYKPDTVIALGGGSAIDEAKAIMHFSKQIGDLPDMEFIAVPTTSGTGSEVTSFAVITDKDKGVKYPLVDKSLLPDIAVLEVTLYRLLERDICLFSASCIMKNIQFDITIEAEKDSNICIIPAVIYKRLMEESAAVSNYTNEIMAARFSEVMWLIEQIMWKTFDRRLASFLLEEMALEGSSGLKITHETIAGHLGTAREVVTRMLRYFQEEGMVKLSRGMINITDEKRLRKLAES